MTNLDILPPRKYHEIRSKWKEQLEFRYEYRHEKFYFRVEGIHTYGYLVSFHISEGTAGTGFAVYSDDKDIQSYNRLFEFLEPRIRPYRPDFQVVDEQQLCLF